MSALKPLNEVAANMAEFIAEAKPFLPGKMQRKASQLVDEFRGNTCAHDMVETVRGVEVCLVCRSVL